MKAILIAALVAAGAAHAQTNWKLATGYRVESFHTQNILQFGRDVDTATRGELLIQVYPNNTLAKLADISAAVQQGKAEAGETIMTSMVKEIPLAGADSIPFVVTSYRDAQRLWKLQPGGGSSGEGSSPTILIFSARRAASMLGVADSSARV